MKKLFLFIIFSTQLLLVPFIESLEQEKLYDFLIEYNSSSEKKEWGWDRLAYSIEKGHVDVASFFVLRGEKVQQYWEIHPSDPDKIVNLTGKNYYDYHFKQPLITAIRNGYNDLAIEIMQMNVRFFGRIGGGGKDMAIL